MKELRTQFTGGNTYLKGKRRGEEKGREKKEKDSGFGKAGKSKGEWQIIEGKEGRDTEGSEAGASLLQKEEEASEEKKTEEKGGEKETKGKEAWRGKAYREDDEFWRVPISNDEWGEGREKETFRCKEGGWWTKMPEERFMAWQFMRDLKGGPAR